MKIHKRSSDKDLEAVCKNGLFVETDLTDDDKAVTCGNCRRIARLPPVPKKKAKRGEVRS